MCSNWLKPNAPHNQAERKRRMAKEVFGALISARIFKVRSSQVLDAHQGIEILASVASCNENWMIYNMRHKPLIIQAWSHLFSEFSPSNQPGSTTIADGSDVPVTGKGSTCMHSALLKDVSYVPKFPVDRIMVNLFVKELACSVSFHPDHCVFNEFKSGKIIGRDCQ